MPVAATYGFDRALAAIGHRECQHFGIGHFAQDRLPNDFADLGAAHVPFK
jgi:hypothetical protein